MPALLKNAYETFAQARARGAPALHAAREAGLARNAAHRLSKRADVIERIAELTADAGWGEGSDIPVVIARMLRLANQAGKLGSASAMMAAKALLSEAARLRLGLPAPAIAFTPPAPQMTTEEWVAQLPPRD